MAKKIKRAKTVKTGDATRCFVISRGGGGEWQRGLEPSYMIAPVKKFGRVRLSANFPSKQILQRMQTWKDDEFFARY